MIETFASTTLARTAPPALLCGRNERPLSELGEEIALLSARIQAATHQLLVMLRRFDEAEGWRGFRSCADWLSWRTGLDLATAREKVRVARALGELPRLSEAMSRGEISYSKGRALTRVATSENESELLETAKAATASQLERIVRGWRQIDRQVEGERDERRHRRRTVRLHTDDDGMLVVRARLEPEAGAVLRKALEAAQEELFRQAREEAEEQSDVSAETSTVVEESKVPAECRSADALVLVAEKALSSRATVSAADRYQVVIHVGEGQAGAAVLEDGAGVSAETCRRIGCDASLVAMHHSADGSVLDVGRRTRAVPPPLRRALEHRDGACCRFPGRRVRHTDAHHIRHWAEGGETKLDNLVLLCRRHHRAVHQEGWQVRRAEGGEVMFRGPRGHRLRASPLQPPPGPAPLEALLGDLEAMGVRIDEAPSEPAWWADETFDLGFALEVLWRPTAERSPTEDGRDEVR